MLYITGILYSLPQAGFEPGIYDSLLLEFAVAYKPTQSPRPCSIRFYTWILYSSILLKVRNDELIHEWNTLHNHEFI